MEGKTEIFYKLRNTIDVFLIFCNAITFFGLFTSHSWQFVVSVSVNL